VFGGHTTTISHHIHTYVDLVFITKYNILYCIIEYNQMDFYFLAVKLFSNRIMF
jgi:hypothetical protein